MTNKQMDMAMMNEWCGTANIDYISEERGLSNLWKYAVPKYIDEIKAGVSSNYIGNAYARLFERWQKQLFFTNWEDPTLALFWVLNKFKEVG